MDVTFSYGIVIRRKAISQRQVNLQSVYDAFEITKPFSEDADMICFGPLFGPEASKMIISRLKGLGLTYVDDFYELAFDHPDWLRFSARFHSQQK